MRPTTSTMLQQNNNNNYPCHNMAGSTRQMLQKCSRAALPLPGRLELGLGDLPLIRGLRAWALCSKSRRKAGSLLGGAGGKEGRQAPLTPPGVRGASAACPRPADVYPSQEWPRMGYGLPLGMDGRQAGIGALVTVATLKPSEGSAKTQTQCLFLRTEKGSCLYSTAKPGTPSSVVGGWLRGKAGGGGRVGGGGAGGSKDNGPTAPAQTGANRVRVRSVRRWRKSGHAASRERRRRSGERPVEERQEEGLDGPQGPPQQVSRGATRCHGDSPEAGSQCGGRAQRRAVQEEQEDGGLHQSQPPCSVAESNPERQSHRDSRRSDGPREPGRHRERPTFPDEHGVPDQDRDTEGGDPVRGQSRPVTEEVWREQAPPRVAGSVGERRHSESSSEFTCTSTGRTSTGGTAESSGPVGDRTDPQSHCHQEELHRSQTQLGGGAAGDSECLLEEDVCRSKPQEVEQDHAVNQEQKKPEETNEQLEGGEGSSSSSSSSSSSVRLRDSSVSEEEEEERDEAVTGDGAEEEWRSEGRDACGQTSVTHCEPTAEPGTDVPAEPSSSSSSLHPANPTPPPEFMATALQCVEVAEEEDEEEEEEEHQELEEVRATAGAAGEDQKGRKRQELEERSSTVATEDEKQEEEQQEEGEGEEEEEEEDEFGVFMQAEGEPAWSEEFSPSASVHCGSRERVGPGDQAACEEPAHWTAGWMNESDDSWAAFPRELPEERREAAAPWWPSRAVERRGLLSTNQDPVSVLAEAFPHRPAPSSRDLHAVPTLTQLLRGRAGPDQGLLDGFHDLNKMIGQRYKRANGVSHHRLLGALQLQQPHNETRPALWAANRRLSPGLPSANQHAHSAAAKRRSSYDHNRNVTE